MKDCTTCKYYCKDYHREWAGALTPGNYCIRNGISRRDAILVRVPCENCSDYEKKEEETKEEYDIEVNIKQYDEFEELRTSMKEFILDKKPAMEICGTPPDGKAKRRERRRLERLQNKRRR